MTLPDDAAARKTIPLAAGVLDYFPSALVAVAALSAKGNDQHNPAAYAAATARLTDEE